LYRLAGGFRFFHTRIFELGQIRIAGDRPLSGRQALTLDFNYDGGGYGRGGTFKLYQGERLLGSAQVPASPPAYFSIDETFDIGLDSGSPAGHYPADAAPGYVFTGGDIHRVDIKLHEWSAPQNES
jgi:arylsulfatase